MEKKEFFINAINMIEDNGSKNIPTALYYEQSNKPLIGSAALSVTDNQLEINEDFKIDIGFIEPGSSGSHRKYKTATGDYKSAVGLAADFLNQIIKVINSWLISNGKNVKFSIMIAEPLALQGELASESWLSKYRGNLSRILGGIKVENISFLPEPFAVFQYYRHGMRYPVIAGRSKQCALIVDFGGGTFDVCIIETNKEGDISRGGRNSLPLAASSAPIGGFFINRMIAEYLFKKYFDKPKDLFAKIGKGFALYKDWRKNKVDLSTLSNDFLNFIQNFHEVVYRIEKAKLTICQNIFDWRLDAELNITVPITLPESPFSQGGKKINTKIIGKELREIFIDKIWKQHLKNIINQTLQRGKEYLENAPPISVILLSGGSANIGWLQELIKNEFIDQLRNAEILRLPDFQEVVSKGLAVECARKYFNKEGDFSSITYNRLCLILDSDCNGYEQKSFKSIGEGMPDVRNNPGVLLPSASILKSFMDNPMKWKVHLEKPPRRQLDYYFLRSSYDPQDLDNLQNIENRTIFTPKNCIFDSDIKIELLVKSDGTAIPNFIYKSGRTAKDRIEVKGKPFYIDMTCIETENVSEAYIGLDFGTSNTSISFIDEFSISTYRKRSTEKNWVELSDLISVLPFPIAAPLNQYLSEPDPIKSKIKAREFIEAALCLGSYISYIEFCINKPRSETRIFKGFTQRSATPLWDLLRTCVEKNGDKDYISSPYKELLNDNNKVIIEEALDFLARSKHGKDKESYDILRPVRLLANISREVFEENIFGHFENIQKQRFSREYNGLFRHAHGSHPPFYNISKYIGTISFSQDDPVIYNKENGNLLSLQPLVFWDDCSDHPDLENGHCYFFDKAGKDNEFSFKATGYSCTCIVSLKSKYLELAERLIQIKKEDPKLSNYKIDLMEEIKIE
ncbi:MAG: hypothetical protein AB1585_09730 [Thermodesulfobacteriota bacterium]